MSHYSSSAKAHYNEIRASWMMLALLAFGGTGWRQEHAPTGPCPCPKILFVHVPWTNRNPHPIEMPTSSTPVACVGR